MDLIKNQEDRDDYNAKENDNSLNILNGNTLSSISILKARNEENYISLRKKKFLALSQKSKSKIKITPNTEKPQEEFNCIDLKKLENTLNIEERLKIELNLLLGKFNSEFFVKTYLLSRNLHLIEYVLEIMKQYNFYINDALGNELNTFEEKINALSILEQLVSDCFCNEDFISTLLKLLLGLNYDNKSNTVIVSSNNNENINDSNSIELLYIDLTHHNPNEINISNNIKQSIASINERIEVIKLNIMSFLSSLFKSNELIIILKEQLWKNLSNNEKIQNCFKKHHQLLFEYLVIENNENLVIKNLDLFSVIFNTQYLSEFSTLFLADTEIKDKFKNIFSCTFYSNNLKLNAIKFVKKLLCRVGNYDYEFYYDLIPDIFSFLSSIRNYNINMIKNDEDIEEYLNIEEIIIFNTNFQQTNLKDHNQIKGDLLDCWRKKKFGSNSNFSNSSSNLSNNEVDAYDKKELKQLIELCLYFLNKLIIKDANRVVSLINNSSFNLLISICTNYRYVFKLYRNIETLTEYSTFYSNNCDVNEIMGFYNMLINHYTLDLIIINYCFKVLLNLLFAENSNILYLVKKGLIEFITTVIQDIILVDNIEKNIEILTSVLLIISNLCSSSVVVVNSCISLLNEVVQLLTYCFDKINSGVMLKPKEYENYLCIIKECYYCVFNSCICGEKDVRDFYLNNTNFSIAKLIVNAIKLQYKDNNLNKILIDSVFVLMLHEESFSFNDAFKSELIYLDIIGKLELLQEVYLKESFGCNNELLSKITNLYEAFMLIIDALNN